MGSRKEDKMKKTGIRAITIALTVAIIAFWCVAPSLAQDKPNIVIIWGDDIGQSNISAYTKGIFRSQLLTP